VFKFLLPLVFILFTFNSHALDFRKVIANMLGEKIATTIFGEKELSVKLPKIPEIKKDAKSTKKLFENNKAKKITKEKSEQLDYQFIKEIFEVTKNKKPNRDDLARWVNVIHQGADREGVYRAMVLDGEYAGLENFENPAREKSIKFVANYFGKYLELEIEPKNLQEVNIYTLKRFCVERTLELIDTFLLEESSLPNLYAWYAVFSAQVAEDYAGVWKSKVRSNSDPLYHLYWARLAPTQYLKSEVILKLHKILNVSMN